MRDITAFVVGALAGLGIAGLQDPAARQRLIDSLGTTTGPTETTGRTLFDPFLREAARAVRLGTGELVTLVAHVRAGISAAFADAVDAPDSRARTASGGCEDGDASAVTDGSDRASVPILTPGEGGRQ